MAESDPRITIASETLVARLERMAPEQGRNPTAWPGMSAFRFDDPVAHPDYNSTLSMCVVARGQKAVHVPEGPVVYDPFHFLVMTLPMKFQAVVTKGPYLSMGVSLPAELVAELSLELPTSPEPSPDLGPHAFVSELNSGLRDALVRLTEAVEDDHSRHVLCPLIQREIVHRLLSTEQAAPLRAAAAQITQAQPLVEMMRYMREHCHERLTVDSLARQARMSTSSFAHGFKALARVSPIRFIKQARLERARLLMLREGLNANEASLEVGYKSPSQFSRDFKRQFGAAPVKYVDRFRGRAFGAPQPMSA